MAGIVGFLPRVARADPAPADMESPARRWAGMMLDAIAHRGPDGLSLAAGPWGALGLAQFRTDTDRAFPTDAVEAGPWWVVADARLDARGSAARAAGVASPAPSDADILARTLERAEARAPGERLEAHPFAALLGDFAVAGLNREDGRLVCLRDAFGVKPFYYADTAEGFAFASEPKALLALPFVSRALDEERIADFVLGQVGDHERTFHAAIRRLPAFHRLERSTEGRLTVTPYGTVEALPAPAPETAPALLAQAFRQAVADRFLPARDPGVLLSGGLDSSSIAVVAAAAAQEAGRGPVRTLSSVFDATPEANERPEIETVLEVGGFAPEWLPQDGHDPLAGMAETLAIEDEPVFAPGIGVLRPVYEAAKAAGMRVLLDGHAGDEVISYGSSRLGELASAGQWLAFWRAAPSATGLSGGSRLTLTWRYGLAFGAGPLWNTPRRAIRLWRRLGRRSKVTSSAPAQDSELSAGLLQRTAVAERVAALQARQKRNLVDEAQSHRDAVTAPGTAYALEVLDKLAAHHGIEPRYPFLDRRVVSLCLGLPASAKLGEGYTRLVMRKAMQGLLPPAIQWRRGKLNFSVHLIDGLQRHRLADIEELLADDGALSAFFDMAAVRRAHARFLAEGRDTPGPVLHLLWRAIVLALWLRDVYPAGGRAAPPAAPSSATASPFSPEVTS